MGLLRVSSSPVKSDSTMMSSRPLPVVGPQCLYCMWEYQGQSEKIPFFLCNDRAEKYSVCICVVRVCANAFNISGK